MIKIPNTDYLPSRVFLQLINTRYHIFFWLIISVHLYTCSILHIYNLSISVICKFSLDAESQSLIRYCHLEGSDFSVQCYLILKYFSVFLTYHEML